MLAKKSFVMNTSAVSETFDIILIVSLFLPVGSSFSCDFSAH